MNEAIAPTQIVWAEQEDMTHLWGLSHLPNAGKPKECPGQLTVQSLASGVLAHMDSLASLLLKALHTPTFSCIGHFQTSLSLLRNLRQVSWLWDLHLIAKVSDGFKALLKKKT